MEEAVDILQAVHTVVVGHKPEAAEGILVVVASFQVRHNQVVVVMAFLG